MDELIYCSECGKQDAYCKCGSEELSDWLSRSADVFEELNRLSREDARKATPLERAEYARGWKNDPAFDSFGFIPDQYCCRGECCGGGSWCCARAGKHSHE